MAVVTGGMKALEARARHEAKLRGQPASTAHLLLVMLRSGDSTARVLTEAGIREGDLLSALKAVESEHTSTLERILERSARVARELGAFETEPVHALLVMSSDTRTRAFQCLAKLGIGAERVHRATRGLLGLEPPPAPRVEPPRLTRPIPMRPLPARRVASMARPASAQVTPPAPLEPEAKTGVATPAPKKNARVSRAEPAASAELGPFDLDPAICPFLASVGRNLTAMAAKGEIDPVIGRDREIDQLLDVLARRRSNNPVLVGPPGVGKTSVVEGLALALVRGGDPVRGLEGTIVVELSAGALVSGTGVRGALSDRIRKLREEVARTRGRVVLFLDEIHAIVGSGEGPDDLGNELKAALARGELACIGATTDAEFRKHFEKDPALVRRFSIVTVDEPTPEATVAILRGLVPRYETHHAVVFERDAIESAVELSVRFLPERKLPDKAIAVLDLAGARVRRRGALRVDRKAVASVIAEQAKVPVDRLLLRDAERLLHLESHLGERVVGHAAPLARIADALRKGAAGFRGRRPLGTFLLLGPTGVGKTETAKAIAEVFFAGSPMTRLDMSEYAEPHTVARLLGAPPGYVGHDEGGQLTEAVRKRPYQLVLLDEIEKAHPDVLLSLLPLLDEGRLTDGRGRTVDFTNTIIVLTSNLGAAAAAERTARIGFGAAPTASASGESKALAAARGALPPELWNRIDEPLYFGPLGPDEVAEIARRLLASVATTLQREHGVLLDVAASAIDALVSAGGYDASLGARPMKRVIGRLVESPLASALLEGRFRRGDLVTIEGEGERLRFAASRATDAAE